MPHPTCFPSPVSRRRLGTQVAPKKSHSYNPYSESKEDKEFQKLLGLRKAPSFLQSCSPTINSRTRSAWRPASDDEAGQAASCGLLLQSNAASRGINECGNEEKKLLLSEAARSSSSSGNSATSASSLSSASKAVSRLRRSNSNSSGGGAGSKQRKNIIVSSASSTAGNGAGKKICQQEGKQAAEHIRTLTTDSESKDCLSPPGGYVTIVEINGKHEHDIKVNQVEPTSPPRKDSSKPLKVHFSDDSNNSSAYEAAKSFSDNFLARSSSLSSGSKIPVGGSLKLTRRSSASAISSRHHHISASSGVSSLTNRNTHKESAQPFYSLPIEVNRASSTVEEELTLYRAPGEALGLGLRFDGGAKAYEPVRRLFVQCCADDSPAAGIKCTWGKLSAGDEILAIENKLVRRLTRVDCVKALKDSPVSVKMRIRHYFSNTASASYDLTKTLQPKDDADFPKASLSLLDSYEQRSQTLPNPSRLRKLDFTKTETSERRTKLFQPRSISRSVSQSSLIRIDPTASGDESPITIIQTGANEDPLAAAPLRTRSLSVPSLLGPPQQFRDEHTEPQQRSYSASRWSPPKEAKLGTKALIERSRSSRGLTDGRRASTLPRKGSLYKKAQKGVHFSPNIKSICGENKTLPRSHKIRPQSILTSNGAAGQTGGEVETFVDDRDEDDVVPKAEEEPPYDIPRVLNESPPDLTEESKLVQEILTVQEKLKGKEEDSAPQAELYMNLLDDDELLGNDNSTYPSIDGDIIDLYGNSTYANALREDSELSLPQPLQPLNRIPGGSLLSTPRSSFTAADCDPERQRMLSLARVLRPFEKLEEEFQPEVMLEGDDEDLDDLCQPPEGVFKPPSAFGSATDSDDDDNDEVGSAVDSSFHYYRGDDNTTRSLGNLQEHPCLPRSAEGSLQDLQPGSYLTLDRRRLAARKPNHDKELASSESSARTEDTSEEETASATMSTASSEENSVASQSLDRKRIPRPAGDEAQLLQLPPPCSVSVSNPAIFRRHEPILEDFGAFRLPRSSSSSSSSEVLRSSPNILPSDLRRVDENLSCSTTEFDVDEVVLEDFTSREVHIERWETPAVRKEPAFSLHDYPGLKYIDDSSNAASPTTSCSSFQPITVFKSTENPISVDSSPEVSLENWILPPVFDPSLPTQGPIAVDSEPQSLSSVCSSEDKSKMSLSRSRGFQSLHIDTTSTEEVFVDSSSSSSSDTMVASPPASWTSPPRESGSNATFSFESSNKLNFSPKPYSRELASPTFKHVHSTNSGRIERSFTGSLPPHLIRRPASRPPPPPTTPPDRRPVSSSPTSYTTSKFLSAMSPSHSPPLPAPPPPLHELSPTSLQSLSSFPSPPQSPESSPSPPPPPIPSRSAAPERTPPAIQPRHSLSPTTPPVAAPRKVSQKESARRPKSPDDEPPPPLPPRRDLMSKVNEVGSAPSPTTPSPLLNDGQVFVVKSSSAVGENKDKKRIELEIQLDNNSPRARRKSQKKKKKKQAREKKREEQQALLIKPEKVTVTAGDIPKETPAAFIKQSLFSSHPPGAGEKLSGPHRASLTRPPVNTNYMTVEEVTDPAPETPPRPSKTTTTQTILEPPSPLRSPKPKHKEHSSPAANGSNYQPESPKRGKDKQDVAEHISKLVSQRMDWEKKAKENNTISNKDYISSHQNRSESDIVQSINQGAERDAARKELLPARYASASELRRDGKERKKSVGEIRSIFEHRSAPDKQNIQAASKSSSSSAPRSEDNPLLFMSPKPTDSSQLLKKHSVQSARITPSPSSPLVEVKKPILKSILKSSPEFRRSLEERARVEEQLAAAPAAVADAAAPPLPAPAPAEAFSRSYSNGKLAHDGGTEAACQRETSPAPPAGAADAANAPGDSAAAAAAAGQKGLLLEERRSWLQQQQQREQQREQLPALQAERKTAATTSSKSSRAAWNLATRGEGKDDDDGEEAKGKPKARDDQQPKQQPRQQQPKEQQPKEQQQKQRRAKQLQQQSEPGIREFQSSSPPVSQFQDKTTAAAPPAREEKRSSSSSGYYSWQPPPPRELPVKVLAQKGWEQEDPYMLAEVLYDLDSTSRYHARATASLPPQSRPPPIPPPSTSSSDETSSDEFAAGPVSSSAEQEPSCPAEDEALSLSSDPSTVIEQEITVVAPRETQRNKAETASEERRKTSTTDSTASGASSGSSVSLGSSSGNNNSSPTEPVRNRTGQAGNLNRQRSKMEVSTLHPHPHHQHSLSQDSNDSASSVLAAPPSYSRMPPDGHEFPPDYRDPQNGNLNHGNSGNNNSGAGNNSLLLSRKSSASSTGSSSVCDAPMPMPTMAKAVPKGAFLRHDEHSIKSVRDKIALFSTKTQCHHQSTEDMTTVAGTPQPRPMTRAYTHGDVRFGQAKGLNCRSMTNMSKGFAATGNKSVSSADLSSHHHHSGGYHNRQNTHSHHALKKSPTGGGRSQSLLEIGPTITTARLYNTHTLPKVEPVSSPAHKAAATIHEKKEEKASDFNSLEMDIGEAKQINLDNGVRLSLSTPPWKSAQSSSSSNPGSSKSYSPAFKRKPFVVYNSSSPTSMVQRKTPSPQNHSEGSASSTRGIGGPPLSRRESLEPQKKRQSPVSLITKRGEDSDNDSAVSSGRSSISQSSSRGSAASPPPTKPARPGTSGRSGSRGTGCLSPPMACSTPEDPRILKKHSIEAINRRNILESCKQSNGVKKKTSITEFRAIEAKEMKPTATIGSLGKPASRSSSFTIAERKKSFEAMTSRLSSTDSRRGSHSSQDSLASSKRASDLQLSSRRSSRETIGEESEQEAASASSRRSSRSEADGGSRVTTPTALGHHSSLKSASPEQYDRSESVTPTEKIDSITVSAEKATNFASLATSGKDPNFKRSTSIASRDSGVEDPPVNVEQQRWSSLEKKYSSSSSSRALLTLGDARTKIAQFDTTYDRPKDLAFGPSLGKKTSNASSVASPGSAKSIRELTERFEHSKTPTNATAPALPSRKDSVMSTASSVLTDESSCSVSSTQTAFRLGEITGSSMMTSAGGGGFVSSSWLEESSANAAKAAFYIPEESAEWESFDPATPYEKFCSSFRPSHPAPSSSSTTTTSTSKYSATSTNIVDRKYSAPAYPTSGAKDASGSVKLRDRKEGGASNNAAPSRPSSLIETSAGGTSDIKVFEMGHLGGDRERHLISGSTSQSSSQADLLDTTSEVETPLKSPLLPSTSSSSSVVGGPAHSVSSRELMEMDASFNGAKDDANRRSVSVNDIRRAFEKAEASLNSSNGMSISRCSKSSTSSSMSMGLAPCHNRMSSLDSTTSDESSIPTPHYYGSVSSLLSGQTNLKDHYGSITSLASSTSIISPQELQGLIDEANQSLEESGTPSHEIMVIVLHREFTSGSIGITLAGGADYESKDITVHKVIPGTLADRDGRIQKGDRVLSINGRSTKGVTHREALSILKAPRAEVVLVLSRSRSVTPAESGMFDRSSGSDYSTPYSYVNIGSSRPPKILESPLDSKSLLSDLKFVDVPRGAPMTVILKKEGTGLGFSLEGGKDSPLGDRPLTIKKIFTGGAADKTKVLKVGDEIISVNNTDCTRMSRIEAWNFMKKLLDGTATIVVRQKLPETKESAKEAPKKASNAVEEEAKSEAGSSAEPPVTTPKKPLEEATLNKMDRTIEETKQI